MVVEDAKLGESVRPLLRVNPESVETEDAARVIVVVYGVVAPLAA